MLRDLFGEPIPDKKPRRSKSPDDQPAAKPARSPRQLALRSAGAELGDLVGRLKPLHKRLEDDLTRTLAADATVQQRVTAQCRELSQREGVAISQKQYVRTAAVVYTLQALFLRVAEDYGLFPTQACKIAKRGDIFQTLRSLAPRLTWADYLEYAVRDMAYLPVAYDLFKETGYELIAPSSELAHDLLDAVADLPPLRDMDTRALGDLYEHLMDEDERKRLGYYTTPDFIIDFLLERTLEPAIKEFGVHELRYLDPAGGTGHFLVSAYRVMDKYLAHEDPDLTPLQRFERIVENNLFGIDVSEFATRITLFRLFLEGVRLAQREGKDPAAWGVDITFNVYTANSLIKLPQEERQAPLLEDGQPPRREGDRIARWYQRELTHLRVDLKDALLKHFHVINANPPYVRIQTQGAHVVAPVNGHWETVEFVDYLRRKYATASGNFDLSVPFMERGLGLLVPGGYLGYITSGKFSKQAYGGKLAVLLAGANYRLLLFADLTDAHVFEAAAFPALLVMQRPASRDAMAADASVDVLATYQPAGKTAQDNWDALLPLLSASGDRFETHAGRYAERRDHFRQHPWTLRRSRQDLLQRIKAVSNKTLADHARTGVDFMTNADSVFCDYITESFIRRQRLEREICLPCLRGENIRNWTLTWHGNRNKEQTYAIATGVNRVADIEQYPNVARFLLRYKRYLEARRIYGDTLMNIRKWYEFWFWGSELGVPKIVFPQTGMHQHFILDMRGEFIARDSCQVVYPVAMPENGYRALVAILNSSLFCYFVRHRAMKLTGKTEEKSRMDLYAKDVESFPMSPDWSSAFSPSLLASPLHGATKVADESHPYTIVRAGGFINSSALQAMITASHANRSQMLQLLPQAQAELDHAVSELYNLADPTSLLELASPVFVRPWKDVDWDRQFAYETLDLICDLTEDLFATQRSGQERPLAPAEIAAALAANPKFEPLRAVYYGGKPVSAEQFVRECMDWDCRPIPFDQESVLVGRKPKRVDVLHERFFRFDSVNRNLYGWTGWSAEAQASVFLTLAERAPDKLPYYRWVARLIDLPEESPDISDPETRAELRKMIGDAKAWPYVVME